MPISTLKSDFTNIPAGTKVTVGSILFGMLELPEEVVATDAAPAGTGERLQTQAVARPAAAAVADGGGGGHVGEGDPFSRIEIKVGRITKVSRAEPSEDQSGNILPGLVCVSGGVVLCCVRCVGDVCSDRIMKRLLTFLAYHTPATRSNY